MADSDGVLDPLARWNSTLWFVSGAIGVVYASLYGMEAFLGTYPAAREFFGPVMNVVAFSALLGLYPVLADRRPWLARAGGIFAALAIVGSVLTLVATAGLVSEGVTWLAASQLLFIIVGMTLAFLAFGAASLRSEVYSRTVGLLLLAPVVVMGLNLGIVVAGYASPEGRLLVSGLWAVAYLVIGAKLRTETESAEHEEVGVDAVSDATVRR